MPSATNARWLKTLGRLPWWRTRAYAAKKAGNGHARAYEFDESEHPRAEDGKWIDAGGGSLNESDRLSLIRYSGDRADEINHYLRAGNDAKTGMHRDEIQRLDSILKKSRTVSPQTVYRISASIGKGSPDVGKIVTELGFLSTSADSKYLEHPGKGSYPWKMVLNIPSGIGAIRMNEHRVSGRPYEDEVLLERDLRLRVDRIEGKLVHVTVLPPLRSKQLALLSKGPHSFASTQLDLPNDLQARLRAWVLANVAKEDLSPDEAQDDAFHVTVLYGLKTDRHETVRLFVEGTGPVRITLGVVTQFDKDPRYDVLIVPVARETGLRALRKRLTDHLPWEATQAGYAPHVTLAYVRKGTGRRHLGVTAFLGEAAALDRLRVSDSQGTASWVSLLPVKAFAKDEQVEGPGGKIGVWRTIRGRAVFIGEGESLENALGKAEGGQSLSVGKARVATDQEGFGIVSDKGYYGGVHEDEWSDWAYGSWDIQSALDGTLKIGESSSIDGSPLTAKDVVRYKDIAQRMQKAASSNAVGEAVFFRGESFESLEALKSRYKHRANIEFKTLTSVTSSLKAAQQYVDDKVAGPVRVVLHIENKHRAHLGIQTAPFGVPSNEVIMPKGATYRVAQTLWDYYGKETHRIDLYSTKDVRAHDVPVVNVLTPGARKKTKHTNGHGRVYVAPIESLKQGEVLEINPETGERGVWRNVGGRSIFIAVAKGESVPDAVKRAQGDGSQQRPTTGRREDAKLAVRQEIARIQKIMPNLAPGALRQVIEPVIATRLAREYPQTDVEARVFLHETVQAEQFLKDELQTESPIFSPDGPTLEARQAVGRYADALLAWTKSTKNEAGAMIDNKTGKRIGPVQKGSESQTPASAQIIRLKRGSDATYLHTHPNSSSFSGGDMAFLARVPQIRRMVVRAADGTTYTLEKPARFHSQKEPVDPSAIDSIWKGHRQELMRKYEGQLAPDRSNMDVLWKEHTHEISERTAKDLRLVYRRFEPGDRTFSRHGGAAAVVGDDSRRFGDRDAAIRGGRAFALLKTPYGYDLPLSRDPTPFERKVDFGAIERELSRLAAQGRERVRGLLLAARDKLAALVERKHKAGQLTTKFVLDLELRGLGELVPTLREVLRVAFQVGQRQANDEIYRGRMGLRLERARGFAAKPIEPLKKGEVLEIGPEGKRGVWRSILGNPIFIEVQPGESVPEAVKRTEQSDEPMRNVLPSGVFLHATPKSRLKAIQKEGLLRDRPRNFSLTQSGAVYLTKSVLEAEDFGMLAVDRRGGQFVILTVELSPEQIRGLEDDKNFRPGTGNYLYNGDIPKSAIKSMTPYRITQRQVGQNQSGLFERGETKVVKFRQVQGIFYLPYIPKRESTFSKAMYQDYQVKLVPEGLPPAKALEFFERKSVLLGTEVKGPLLGQVKTVLFNAIKTGEGLRETIAAVQAAFLPWLGDEDQAIDEAAISPYRIETLIRTNSIEAFNEGRKAMFEPEVESGFIIGMQFSAILDEGTTPVCRFLDQKIFRPDSPDVDQLSPPRHWNCRSLLSAVLRTEGPVEYITPPQVARGIDLSGKGFGDLREVRRYEWDESLHPREAEGAETGGQFAPGGGGGNGGSSEGDGESTERSITSSEAGKDRTFLDVDGKPVSGKTLARIKSLGLPPAWKNVRVSMDPDAPLQATGVDAAGRLQYRYSKARTGEQAAAKFARVAALAKRYADVQKSIRADLTNGLEEAVVMGLVLKTAMRAGGGSETAIGATTLEVRHLSISEDKVVFNFPGKSGVQWRGTVRDADLAKALGKQLAGKDRRERVFSVSASDVNAYLKQYGKMSMKDVRTLQGTALAKQAMAKHGIPRTKTAAKKLVSTVAKAVAKALRNTPAVAKSSYIDPIVWAPLEARFAFAVRKLAEERESELLSGDDSFLGIDAVVEDYLADLLRDFDRRTWDEAPDKDVGLDDLDDDEADGSTVRVERKAELALV